MNIKKIEKQLKKINQLFDNIKEDGTISPIEKDLMLSYIRSLYEKLLDPVEEASSEKEPSKNGKNKPKAQPIQVEEKEENPIATVVMQEVVKAQAKETPNPAPVETSSIQKETLSSSTPTEVVTKEIPQEILDLFTFESGGELSDKLSRSPITDLTKCMGINEKIFTVQELFGGDSNAFNRAMEKMNSFSSLDQAREYLIEHVAVKQNWAAEEKVKKASNFIKLISRKY